MARPKEQIGAEQVTKLAALGATHQEIAHFFGVDRSTITKRFSPEIAKGRAEVRFKLRRWQLEAAERGNTAMLIWLGKNMLGQSETGDDLTWDGQPPPSPPLPKSVAEVIDAIENL